MLSERSRLGSLFCAFARMGLEHTFNVPRKQREFDSPKAHSSKVSYPEKYFENVFINEGIFVRKSFKLVYIL